MSTVKVGFIPFGAFEPDLPEFDNTSLEEARNLVPAYGTYRPLEVLTALSSQETDDSDDEIALVGGYAHLTTKDNPKYNMVPVEASVEVPGAWYDREYELVADDNAYHADQVDSLRPDDSTFIRADGVQGEVADVDGDPSHRVYWKLKPPKETPDSATFADYVVKVRAQSWWPGEWSAPRIQFGIHDRATDTEVCESIQTMEVYGPNEVGPQEVEEFEYPLADAPELAKITDWDQVELWVDCSRGLVQNVLSGTLLDSLLSDFQVGGWVGNGGEVSGLYLHCRYRGHGVPDWDPPEDVERDAFETDWIVSPPVYGGESATPYIGQFAYNIIKNPEQADIIHVSAHLGASETGVTCKIQLLQMAIDDGDDVSEANDYVVHGEQRFRIIAESEHDVPKVADINDMDTNQDGEERILSLTTEQVKDIDQNNALFAAFVPSYGEGGGSGTIELDPTSIVSSAGWVGDPTNSVVNIQVAGDGKRYHRSATTNKTLRYTLDPGPIIDGTGALNLKVRAKAVTGTTTLQFFLFQGAELLLKKSVAGISSGAYATYTASIPRGDQFTPGWSWITDWGKLEVGIRAGNLDVDRAWVSYKGENSAQVVLDYVHGEEGRDYAQSVSVTKAWFEVPPPRDYQPGDRVDLFTGDSIKLWKAAAGGWEDLTNYTDHANGYDDPAVVTDNIPRTWSFCSWGDWVIATNYVDPVQYYDVGLGTGEFDDLITTGVGEEPGEAPKARFVATIAAQLVLADINPDSYAAGEKYQLWPSAFGDPTEFYQADYNTQSSVFNLVAAPGQITGLIGGEYGLVFKRNSVWRMSYRGLPELYKFDQLSRGTGTAWAQSIVQVDNDTYFWGSNGIFVIKDGKQVRRVSGQRIEKFLFDVQYEDRALYRVEDPDERITDSMVQGAYDKSSGLIWWSYRQKSDAAFRNSMMLVYNPREDKFSFIDGVDTSVLVGLSSAMSDAKFLNEGVANIRWEPSVPGPGSANYGYLETFSGLTTYSGGLKTKILSSQVLAKAPGRDMAIQAVRPIYKADPSSYAPNFSVSITGSQDPSLQINTVQRTVDRRHEDLDGWISTSIPVGGEYFRFELEVPSISESTIKEILGLGIKFTYAGKY